MNQAHLHVYAVTFANGAMKDAGHVNVYMVPASVQRDICILVLLCKPAVEARNTHAQLQLELTNQQGIFALFWLK